MKKARRSRSAAWVAFALTWMLGAGARGHVDPAALEIERESAVWSREGWWRWTVHPPHAPQRWSVHSPTIRFDATVVPAGERPVLVFLPQLDGTAAIAEYVARRAAAAGWQVIAVEPPRVALQPGAHPNDWIRLLEERVLIGHVALSLARAELEAPCVALVGISLGAMSAVTVAADDGAVDALALMLAGGNLRSIALESAEPRLAQWAATGSELAPDLGRRLAKLDPASRAGSIERSSVLLVRAAWDRVIPAEATADLWRRLGRPRLQAYPAGHNSFAIFLPWALDGVLAHSTRRCVRKG